MASATPAPPAHTSATAAATTTYSVATQSQGTMATPKAMPTTVAVSSRQPAWVPNHFAAGAVAGVVAAVATCPLEVVKTRMQAGAGSMAFSTSASSYRGLGAWRSAVTDVVLRPSRFVVREIRGVAAREGVKGLWRGIFPQIIGVAPARAVYFQTYDTSRTMLARNGVTGSFLHLVSAAAAGMTVATALSPVWVIKTRLQIQTNVDHVMADGKPLRNYNGAVDAFRGILREEGVRGLYRGLSASYLGVTEGATHFVMYQALKREARERGIATTPFTSFCMAAMCKLVASAVTYPHEVVRTRLRDRVANSGPGGRRYNGLVQAFRRVVAEEGVRGLYSGMAPHLMRVVPNAALLFCVMEVLLGGNI